MWIWISEHSMESMFAQPGRISVIWVRHWRFFYFKIWLISSNVFTVREYVSAVLERFSSKYFCHYWTIHDHYYIVLTKSSRKQEILQVYIVFEIWPRGQSQIGWSFTNLCPKGSNFLKDSPIGIFDETDLMSFRYR